MSQSLQGKVAFITGLARGQGRSHAIRLAEEGADIVGLDVCAQLPSVGYPMSTPADLDETVRLVEAHDRRIVARVGDVRDVESIRAVYAEGLATFGHIDYVVANAGVMPIWGESAQTMDSWQDCLDVILTGALNTVQVAYPHLLEQGTGGSIVITGSMAGVIPSMRTLDFCTLGLLGYSAAKAALVNLAENYASVLAHHNIRVNVVHPTGVKTPMIENDLVTNRFATANPEDLKAILNAMPVDAVEPVDVSNAVVWLCSDASRYVTGTALRVDAGANLR
jgi:SDR family mycofactocin-dependent oxidoreductase